MGPTVIQRNIGNDATGGTGSVALAFGSNVTAGNSIVVGAFISANANTGLSTPTDTQGNTYTLLVNTNTGSHAIGMKAWLVSSIKSSAANTVTMSDGFNTTVMAIWEIGAASLDKSAFAYQNSATSLSSSSTATTSSANELLLGLFANGATSASTYTAGSGWSNLQTSSPLFLESATEEQVVSGTGAYAATASLLANAAYTLSYILTFQTPSTGSNVAVSDTTVTSEFVNLLIPTLFIGVTDTTVTSEAVSSQIVYSVAISDSTITSENVLVGEATQLKVSDSTVTSESVSMLLISGAIGLAITSSTSTSENVTVLIPTLSVSVSDSTVTSESVSRVLVSLALVSDTTTTSESVDPLIATQLKVSDSTVTSESTTLQFGSNIAVADITVTSETVTVNPVVAGSDLVTVSDSTTTSENVTMLFSISVKVSDTTITSEAISIIEPRFISVSDSTTTSESVGLAVAVTIRTSDTTLTSELVNFDNLNRHTSVSDTTTTSESVSLDIIAFTQSYTRLNFSMERTGAVAISVKRVENPTFKMKVGAL